MQTPLRRAEGGGQEREQARGRGTQLPLQGAGLGQLGLVEEAPLEPGLDHRLLDLGGVVLTHGARRYGIEQRTRSSTEVAPLGRGERPLTG